MNCDIFVVIYSNFVITFWYVSMGVLGHTYFQQNPQQNRGRFLFVESLLQTTNLFYIHKYRVDSSAIDNRKNTDDKVHNTEHVYMNLHVVPKKTFLQDFSKNCFQFTGNS